MKHIFLNLKRFDIAPEHGGVNRLAPMKDWGRVIVERFEKYGVNPDDIPAVLV